MLIQNRIYEMRGLKKCADFTRTNNHNDVSELEIKSVFNRCI